MLLALNLAHVLNGIALKLINGENQTNRDQKSNYNDIINIEEFNSNLLKIDRKWYKDIGSYYIVYITIKKIVDYENIYIVNHLYLIIIKVDGHTKEIMEINI